MSKALIYHNSIFPSLSTKPARTVREWPRYTPYCGRRERLHPGSRTGFHRRLAADASRKTTARSQVRALFPYRETQPLFRLVEQFQLLRFHFGVPFNKSFAGPFPDLDRGRLVVSFARAQDLRHLALGLYEAVESPFQFHQFGMGAGLYDLAFFHHDELAGVAQSREAVRDGEGGPALDQAPDRFLNLLFRLDVYRIRRDGRVDDIPSMSDKI